MLQYRHRLSGTLGDIKSVLLETMQVFYGEGFFIMEGSFSAGSL